MFLVTAAAGLALAPSAFADTTYQDLYVARDACGGATPANLRLASATGAFTGSCGSLAAGLGGVDNVYATPAGDEGLPVTLDATRPIHVAVSVSSNPGLVIGGIGEEAVSVSLTGRSGSKTVDLGGATATTPADVMLRQTKHVYEFDLPLTAAKGLTYKSFELVLNVGGAQQSGYVNHGGGSLVSLPVFDPVETPASGQ
jgi:hypothetical protein